VRDSRGKTKKTVCPFGGDDDDEEQKKNKEIHPLHGLAESAYAS
jgi:hypothetical protein